MKGVVSPDVCSDRCFNLSASQSERLSAPSAGQGAERGRQGPRGSASCDFSAQDGAVCSWLRQGMISILKGYCSYPMQMEFTIFLNVFDKRDRRVVGSH